MHDYNRCRSLPVEEVVVIAGVNVSPALERVRDSALSRMRDAALSRVRDSALSCGCGMSRDVVFITRRREEVQWDIFVILRKFNIDLDEISIEFFKFVDDLLHIGVIVIFIIIVAVTMDTIGAFDLSD